MMNRSYTFILLSLMAFAGVAQGRAFQQTEGREAAPASASGNVGGRNQRRTTKVNGNAGRGSERVRKRVRVSAGASSSGVSTDSRARGHVEDGRRRAEEGNWAEAIKAYEQAIAIDPQYAEAHIDLGDAYMSAGKYQEAFAAYRRAIRLAPANADAHYGLGAAHNDMAQYGDAFKPLVQAIQLDPGYAEAYYGIGYAYYRLENFKEAVGYLKSAIRLDPDYLEARMALGSSYIGMGQMKAAEEQRKILEGVDASLAGELGRQLRRAEGDGAPPSASEQSRPTAQSKEARNTQDPAEQRSNTKTLEGGRAQGSESSPQQKSLVPVASPASSLVVELNFWDSIKNNDNPEEFAAYLKKYPAGQFVELARIRMGALERKHRESGSSDAERPQEIVEKQPEVTPEQAKTAETPPPPPPTTSVVRPVIEQPDEVGNGSTLEETIGWLKRNFSSRFKYKYTTRGESPDELSSSHDTTIDFEPLRFEGCKLEWRDIGDTLAVSLSDLDPRSVKVELHAKPNTTFSVEVWNLGLSATDGKDVFVEVKGDGSGATKNYSGMDLQYEDKERARRLATALTHAIKLCGGNGAEL